MAVLKSLTFTTIPTPGGNPVLDRRTKIIARLEEQKHILKDPNYTRTVRNWVKKDGERVMVEKQQRVPLWWRQYPNGSYALFVRSGLKPIEFEWFGGIWIIMFLNRRSHVRVMPGSPAYRQECRVVRLRVR